MDSLISGIPHLGESGGRDAPHGGDGVFAGRRDLVGEFGRYQLDELGQSPRTVQGYRYSLRAIERLLDKPIHKVTAEDLRQVKRSDYSPATKMGLVVAARQFHQWGALEGYWHLNGIMAVRPNRVDKDSRPGMSMETARQLIEACSTPNEHRLVYLGLYAGLRIAESAAITEANWHGDSLSFIGKGRKRRTIPLHSELQRVKLSILRSQPKSPGVLQHVMKKMRDRHEAFDLWGNPARSHSLRKTFGTAVYDEGRVPWEVVATMLGHELGVTRKYVRVGFSQMRDAIRGLDYWGSEPVQLRLFE